MSHLPHRTNRPPATEGNPNGSGNGSANGSGNGNVSPDFGAATANLMRTCTTHSALCLSLMHTNNAQTANADGKGDGNGDGDDDGTRNWQLDTP